MVDVIDWAEMREFKQNKIKIHLENKQFLEPSEDSLNLKLKPSLRPGLL